jgi:hypothetical protein
MPRAVYLTGFEHGATDALATTNPFFTALTGNVTIQSTTARNGGKALKVNAAGAVATATSTWNGSPYDLLARHHLPDATEVRRDRRRSRDGPHCGRHDRHRHLPRHNYRPVAPD